MWACVVPFESGSLESLKAPDVVIKELREVVQLRRHWLWAWFIGPSGQLIGDFGGNRFTLVQKRIVGANFYFPLVRVIVRKSEGGTVLEIHSFAPMFYIAVALVIFMVLTAVRSHQLGIAMIVVIFSAFGHAVSTMAYHWDREGIEVKLRQVL